MSNFYICWRPGLCSYYQHGNLQLSVAPAFSFRLNWHQDIWTCKQNTCAHKNKSWKLKIQLYLFSLNVSRNNTTKRKNESQLFFWNERIFTLAVIIAPGTYEIMKYVRLKNPQLFCFGLFVCFSQRLPNRAMLWDFLGKHEQMSFHPKQGTNKTPKK